MKDMTVSEFCRKFATCKEGRELASNQFPEKADAAVNAARDAQIKIMLEYGNPWLEETKLLNETEFDTRVLGFVKFEPKQTAIDRLRNLGTTQELGPYYGAILELSDRLDAMGGRG